MPDFVGHVSRTCLTLCAALHPPSVDFPDCSLVRGHLAAFVERIVMSFGGDGESGVLESDESDEEDDSDEINVPAKVREASNASNDTPAGRVRVNLISHIARLY